MTLKRYNLETLQVFPFRQDTVSFPTEPLSNEPELVRSGVKSFAEGSVLLNLEAVTQRQGLPIPKVLSAVETSDKTVWVATEQGVCRQRGGHWRYFAGKRWLPDNKVTGIGIFSNDKILVETAKGRAVFEAKPFTLEEKAAHYEAINDARHNRDGYVTDCILERPGDLASWKFLASDNDGLWSALYLCAEAFRYAVTGETVAKDRASKSMRALLNLVTATGIRGFPARTLIRQGERVEASDPGPNWYPSPTMPGVTYKNDTSSDEIVGHYLAWYVYSELVANEKEKKEIASVCRAVTNHMIDNKFYLVGPTGKHTRWGVWAPERLNDDPEWAFERGLNSLEILSHLKVAHKLCGDTKFHDTYKYLIAKHGYAQNVVRQKMLPPEGENNHSDDELAAGSYYPLLLLEESPQLLAYYLQSLERTHDILRPEGSPLYNTLYSACTGNKCDPERSLAWLQEAPLDIRDWKMVNSNRADVIFNPELGRFGEKQLTHVLSPAERRVSKWNANPYAPDGGSDAHSEEDGGFWLLPYWMARYHGVLSATKST